MQDDPIEREEESVYYSLPEEALQHLPEEWRNHIQAIADNGCAILESVDKELSQLVKISNSFTALVALKYTAKRLSEYKFAADMDAILELDMLTTAFVVTYVRLHQGGSGSGFSRAILPQKLRRVHDQIVEMRNKRYAHNDDHHSLSNAMEVGFEDNRFLLKFDLSLEYQIGGATEWHDLTKFLDVMTVEKMEKLLARLKAKTGHDWVWPKAPAPD
ncbi:hypothetical protein HAP48_0004930 [Bradyrhizobium septentrionale]|uniref:Uncharacterized protein n=1 Tax=Bradyrhizobium septentrionale TaxID=1404411 RepID=A0A974A4J8_9BRAD|nr:MULTISPECIES: hypothetical protein [Bradyrhizobium]UGY16864.1 hypothetical protein HAP48_0004930 [Bradyrhizobium septentrionale]